MLHQPLKLNYKEIPLSELDFANTEPYFFKFIKSELGLARIDGLAYVEIEYKNHFEDLPDIEYVAQFTHIKKEFDNVVLEHFHLGKCYTCNYQGHHLILLQDAENKVYAYGLMANKKKVDKVLKMGVYNVKNYL